MRKHWSFFARFFTEYGVWFWQLGAVLAVLLLVIAFETAYSATCGKSCNTDSECTDIACPACPTSAPRKCAACTAFTNQTDCTAHAPLCCWTTGCAACVYIPEYHARWRYLLLAGGALFVLFLVYIFHRGRERLRQ